MKKNQIVERDLRKEAKKFAKEYGHEFNIDNDDLYERLTKMEDEELSNAVIRLMAEKQADSYFGDNAVFCDRLNMDTHFAFSPIIKKEQAREKALDILDEMTWMNDHFLIGYEMKLNKKMIAIHDAVMTIAREAYDPRKVQLAREMYEWLESQNAMPEKLLPEDRLKYGDACWAKYKELVKKYRVYEIDEDETQRYLLGEIVHTGVTTSEGDIFDEYAIETAEAYHKTHRFQSCKLPEPLLKYRFFDRRNPPQEVIDLVYGGNYPDEMRDPYWKPNKSNI